MARSPFPRRPMGDGSNARRLLTRLTPRRRPVADPFLGCDQASNLRVNHRGPFSFYTDRLACVRCSTDLTWDDAP